MAHVKLALSYCAERPRGELAESPEASDYRRRKIDYENGLYNFLDEEEVSRTIFILGDYLVRCKEDYSDETLKEVYVRPFSDTQSHTYQHLPFEKKEFEEHKSANLEDFVRDIVRASETLKTILGVNPKGLGFPYGFHHDLSRYPKLLAELNKLGYKYTSYDTSGVDTLEAPVTPDRQPHSYAHVGFPSLIEVPSHGWQDVVATLEKQKQYKFGVPKSGKKLYDCYKDAVLNVKEMDIGDKSFYLGLALHPWAEFEIDPKRKYITDFIDFARKQGVEFVNFQGIANEFL